MASQPMLARCLAPLVAAAVALAAVPAAAQGKPVGSTPTAVVGGERNVYAGGGQVRPSGPVHGDFVAAGGRVIVDQPVAGDAMLAGGTVDLRSPVGDDVRAMGGDISIESTVGGELFASGGQVAIRPGAVVSGDAALHGGSVTMEGRVEGALRASARKVLLDGEVRGDVHLSGANLELGPKARIAGKLAYASDAELRQAEGAVVARAITREASGRTRHGEPARAGDRGLGRTIVGGLLSFLALLACAAVFLLLLPGLAPQAADRIRSSPGLALVVGFCSLVAVPVLAVLLFLTLLGIPLGIAVLALYPVLLLAGFVVGVLFVARLLPAALHQESPAGLVAGIAWFAAALLIVMLVGSVPFLGGLAVALVSLAGIGAFVLELYRRRQRPPVAGPHVDSGPGRSS